VPPTFLVPARHCGCTVSQSWQAALQSSTAIRTPLNRETTSSKRSFACDATLGRNGRSFVCLLIRGRFDDFGRLQDNAISKRILLHRVRAPSHVVGTSAAQLISAANLFQLQSDSKRQTAILDTSSLGPMQLPIPAAPSGVNCLISKCIFSVRGARCALRTREVAGHPADSRACLARLRCAHTPDRCAAG
jgi:hypothetical protein